MEGTKIVKAWRQWLDSLEGRQTSNPDTLPATPSARQYLENRLERAFQAGIRAAEKDQEIQCQER